MVFISLLKPLEKYLEEDIETRLSNQEWILFDRAIKNKSLKLSEDNSGNLDCYISRIQYYPYYYKEPMYCYLMSDKYFNSLQFFKEEDKNTASIWLMKRIPKRFNDDTHYKMIPEDEMMFGRNGWEESRDYIIKKFSEMTSVDLNKNDYEYVIIDGK
jgi:hypothetical protein